MCAHYIKMAREEKGKKYHTIQIYTKQEGKLDSNHINHTEIRLNKYRVYCIQ